MEKIIIYVAGNPDAYPVEYYDRSSGTYQGVVPELLRQFSDQTAYDVRYYAAGERDQRLELAENRQVDVISCLTGESSVPHSQAEVSLLGSYCLQLLDVAPEGLEPALQSFFTAAVSQRGTELLIETAERHSPHRVYRLENAVLALGLSAAALLAALAVLLHKYRLQKKAARRNQVHDPVTGIGNRTYLENHCAGYLNDKNRRLYRLFYFYFDPTFDTCGEEGAAFLRRVAAVLQDRASDMDILARVADNGFAILRLSAGEQESTEWLRAALEYLNTAPEDGGSVCRLAAGVYPLRTEDRDLNEILLHGFESARAAYQAGEDYRLCTHEHIRSQAEEARLRTDLRRGLDSGEFQMDIQFYVSAATGRVIGGEALPRWVHPERGFLPPERFLPLAMEAGLAARLDEYILRWACNFLEELWRMGQDHFSLSCRISAASLSSGDFPAQCREIMADSRFDRKLLALHLTPWAGDRTAAGETVKALADMDLRIILDQPEEWTAAPADLVVYRPDGLLLAPGLTACGETPAGRAVQRAAVELAHGLGIPAIAGGVETEAQARSLRDAGCDTLQGGLFFQPLPAWNARKKLTESGI